MKNIWKMPLFGLLLAAYAADGQTNQTNSNWSLQLNATGQRSMLLGVSEPLEMSQMQGVDFAFGLTGRMNLSEKVGFRSGAYFRQTKLRYGYQLESQGDLGPAPGLEVVRATVGIDIPLMFDFQLYERGSSSFRWLLGTALHVDIEKRDEYYQYPIGAGPGQASHQPVSLSLTTGFEYALKLGDSHRLLFAPQIGFTIPDRSAYAFSDFTPNVSLMTTGFRTTLEFDGVTRKAIPREGADAAKDRKNVVLIGYGGRSYNQSLNLSYERRLLHLNFARLYSSTSVGAGFYGVFGATGLVASVGGERNALDFGLMAGYIGELNSIDLVPELGYRFTADNGITARLYMSYWSELSEITPAALGLSFGKAF